MAQNNYDYMECVLRCVRALDEVEPGWYEHIHVEDIDTRMCDTDVIGLADAGFDGGGRGLLLDRVIRHAMKQEEKPREFTKLGWLGLNTSCNVRGAVPYNILDEAWRSVIEAKRAGLLP